MSVTVIKSELHYHFLNDSHQDVSITHVYIVSILNDLKEDDNLEEGCLFEKMT